MSNLVIVESPAKAKTIKKYLGKGFEVIASMGHVRDLPKSRLGVDLEGGTFTPEYIDIKGKGDIRRGLKKAAKKSETIYLATDPDREGEAISWHLAHLLKLDVETANRVTFNEITKSGVQNGMENCRHIDINLVNAQQTRRILDRIVGYKISPFLWKKIKKGLSAGRVQSVVMKLIMSKEKEIKDFVQEEYWSIDAKLAPKTRGKHFEAKLSTKDGKKVKIANKEESDAILAELKDKEFVVGNVKKGVRRKTPAPPFITSTLQQEASKRLGFQARRTMKAAQELYEGVEIEGMGAVGLITYMRTDSLRISNEATVAANDFIKNKYGEEYLPKKPRVYKQKSGAQDAHEAVRPTMVDLSPIRIKDALSSDQYKIYKLIWSRFIASQMATALLDTVAAEIKADNYTFKASGYIVKFDGYTVLYEEGKDESEEKKGALPELKEGAGVNVKELIGNQHFTQPPARFTEASLIKSLEENGIGRPSTYAPTITTVITRGYVEREAKSLVPTVLGEITTNLIAEQFKNIVDVEFTANMESNLDKIESGQKDWIETLRDFYKEFSATLEQAEKNMDGTKIKVPEEVTDVICELCGKNMVIKTGRYGKFLACPGFPECKNTKKIVHKVGGICPLCGGEMHAKKSKKGKVYYGCEHNPECPFMSWDRPLDDKCPQCGATLFKKMGKKGKIYCKTEDCGFEKALEEEPKE